MTALIVYLVIGLIFGAIARNMARKRGRSGGLWFVLGFFFSLIAVIVLALIGHTQESIDARLGRVKT